MKYDLIAGALLYTQVFKRKGHVDYYMRVKPVSYMLQSTTIIEGLNKGKPLVVSLTTGNMHFIRGDEMVCAVRSAVMDIED